MVFYKSQTIQDEVTLTLASFTDTNTIILNGLTYTGESTANTANWAGRKFSTAGATDTDDALALANLINTDYVIATDGSITVGVTIVVTTNEDAVTFTAAAAPDYPNHIFDQSGDAAAEVASIVLAINHKDNVTCATSVDGDTVTVTLGDASTSSPRPAPKTSPRASSTTMPATTPPRRASPPASMTRPTASPASPRRPHSTSCP